MAKKQKVKTDDEYLNSTDNLSIEIASLGSSRTKLENRIQQNLKNFTTAQRQIASYILGHPHKAAFQSLSELAYTVGVSNAAMTRFLKAAGFASGDDFKHAFGEHLSEKMGLEKRFKQKVKEFPEEHDFFSSLARVEIEFIQRCVQEIPSAVIEKAGAIIAEKKRVFLWSQRPFWWVVDFLDFRLSRLSKEVIPIIDTGHYIFDKAHIIGPDDVLIGMAFQRSPSDLEILFDFARSRNSKLILLTDLVLIPSKLSADVILSSRRGPSGISNSHTVPMVISNAIALSAGKKLSEAGHPILKELDSLRREFGRKFGQTNLTDLMLPDEEPHDFE